MKKEVSVIVPVYNAQTYLTECIESIVRQEQVDCELILVDADSEDESGKICDEYAKKYEQVRVLHRENEGVSAARNAGLEKAEGEYIVFVDSDDYLPDEYTLKNMAQFARDCGADIVVGEYSRLWNGELLPATSHQAFSKDKRESADFRFKGFFSVGTLSYVWGKMYRRSFLEQWHMTFARYDYAEDKLFNILCYIKGANYGFYHNQVYVYRKNDDSISYRYRMESEKTWMRLAQQLHDELTCAGKKEEFDLVGNIIFFACFFDSKMEYEFCGRKCKVVKALLRRYAAYPLAREAFAAFAGGKYINQISSGMWRVMIRGFCVAMHVHLYSLLSWGIKLLIVGKMDQRLSDTGRRDKE